MTVKNRLMTIAEAADLLKVSKAALALLFAVTGGLLSAFYAFIQEEPCRFISSSVPIVDTSFKAWC